MSNKLFNYFKESKHELKKVTWPGKEKTAKDAVMIVVVIFVAAAFLGLLDFGLTKLLEILLK
ncbi:MAG: preprotein translocase subunit SecE [Patescibacteria group bacterium]|nr:preprotein translocase subunit SecE [Patescibacteria group bacterium]